MGGQPEIRKVEMVEVGRNRSRDSTHDERRRWTLGRDEAARQRSAGDEGYREEEYEPVAAPALPAARPWVAV
jgi:hypothetical protein